MNEDEEDADSELGKQSRGPPEREFGNAESSDIFWSLDDICLQH